MTTAKSAEVTEYKILIDDCEVWTCLSWRAAPAATAAPSVVPLDAAPL